MLHEELVKFAALLEFALCVTRKLPDSLEHTPAFLTHPLRSQLPLARQQHQRLLLHPVDRGEVLQHWVFLTQQDQGAHGYLIYSSDFHGHK